ncbi:hypothetical protein [Cupriavidus taiwanensis]|uniref:hypothetical protein n=1 Tax=Cupriavidus taiwanensis TaxID=164546 RepID=UPI000E17935E|nr:hypothetical protein [Cupriavidus taiwanensis]SOY61349.1 hypothetical protein CBM2592_B100057 [Cupriavidus taiwanensis]SOZ84761.1 hypothetical protein CBM2618_B110057 [Cupriavidus taiwanensis]
MADFNESDGAVWRRSCFHRHGSRQRNFYTHRVAFLTLAPPRCRAALDAMAGDAARH